MTNINKNLKALSVAVILGATILAGVSADARGPRDGGERRGPPQEAFTACEGKSVGDSCTTPTREGDAAGTCQSPKEDKIVCVPEGHKKRNRG